MEYWGILGNLGMTVAISEGQNFKCTLAENGIGPGVSKLGEQKCLQKHWSQSRLSVLGADFRGLAMRTNTGR
jgi:hypothetical protein